MDTQESVTQAVELMRVAYAPRWRFWIGNAKKGEALCDLRRLLQATPRMMPELMDAVYVSEFAELGMRFLREVVSGASDEARRAMDEAGEEREDAHVWRVLESDSEATLSHCYRALRSTHRSIRSAAAEKLQHRHSSLDDATEQEQEEFMSSLEAALQLGGARYLSEILCDLRANRTAREKLQHEGYAASREAEEQGRSPEEQVAAYAAIVDSAPVGPMCVRAQEMVAKIDAGEYGKDPKDDLDDRRHAMKLTIGAMRRAYAQLRAQGR